MSGIQLVPEGGGETIDVPEASTVIGRGAFLKVTDKRVSRSHALLEVVDGKLHLTPTHTNPCFLRGGGKGGQRVLQRDVRQTLEQDDVFGLLPDQLFFTVTYTDTPVNGATRNGPVKKEAVQQKEKRSKPVRKVKEEEEDDDEQDRDEPAQKKRMVSIVRADGRNMALPLTKKRHLPGWMLRLANSPTPVTKTKAKAAPKRAAPAPRRAAPKKRPAVDDFLDDEDDDDDRPVRRQRTKSPRTPAKRRRNVDEDFIDDEDDDDEERPVKRRGKRSRNDDDDDDDDDYGVSKKRGKRQGKKGQDDGEALPGRRPKRAATQKRGSYVEEIVLGEEFDESDEAPARAPARAPAGGDSDSDFQIDGKDDADSGSDTGRRAQPRVKKATGRTPTRGARTAKVRQKYHSEDEEDFGESEDEYIPRPSKRRGGAGRGGRQPTDSEDEEEEEEVKIKVKKPTAKPTATAKSPSKKGKKSCYYGSKCYRKNPDHFKEFSHPDDSSEEEAAAGTDRKGNVKQQVNTEVSKVKRKRQTEGEDEEADDDLPNTYDYNDSFINDTSQSVSQTQQSDADSDEEAEDIEGLKNEAKTFIRNKKLVKPVPGKA